MDPLDQFLAWPESAAHTNGTSNSRADRSAEEARSTLGEPSDSAADQTPVIDRATQPPTDRNSAANSRGTVGDPAVTETPEIPVDSPANQHQDQHPNQHQNPHPDTQAGPENSRMTSSTPVAYRRQLLGGEPALTAQEVAEKAGTSLQDFNDYWLAMGFPPPDPDESLYTDADVDAYRQWTQLLDDEGLQLATGLSLARAGSHLADRLALWQVEALVEDAERRYGLDDSGARLVTLDKMEEYVPLFEDQLIYIWRRQMEALLERITREVALRPRDHSRRRFPLTRSLGFVDMVSYTSNSSAMGDQLVGLIERFEYLCRSAVTAEGGRVVKMIGDAVFFIADDLQTGLRVVTTLMDTLGQTDGILPVRASLIYGDVFSRSGDVFGPPVNLAARLVDIAPTGDILTDAPTAALISAGRGGGGFGVQEFPSTRLRGFGRVSPYMITWDKGTASDTMDTSGS